MTRPDQPALDAFCARHGIHAPLLNTPIAAGRNSRVRRLSNDDGAWILKTYAPQAQHGQERDRLGAEFAFSQYLYANQVSGTAQPIGLDRGLRSALYQALPGRRPDCVDDDSIAQAAQFIVAINRARHTALALGPAADACFSDHDHRTLADTRLQQLITQLQSQRSNGVEQPVETAAYTLLTERLLPCWQALQATLPTSNTPLPLTARMLSPSDFGFHNSLLHQGQLAFVDFEYAGWDDPHKLICDFICQPELPISAAQATQFITALRARLPREYGIDSARIAQLLPLHRLKWCCILLNEFRPVYQQRRLHAGLTATGLLSAQLAKASTYFDTHLASVIGSAAF